MNEKLIDRKAFMEFWQKRYNLKSAFVFLIVYVAGIIGFFLPATEKMNGDPLFIIVWFVLFFSYLLGMPFLWCRILYGKPDPQFLRCPFCKNRLGRINKLVIATGKCGHCGNLILTDSQSESSRDTPPGTTT